MYIVKKYIKKHDFFDKIVLQLWGEKQGEEPLFIKQGF